MKPIACLAASAALSICAHAAVSRDFVVDLKATVGASAPYLTLSWGQRVQANISSQKIHRRLKGEAAWVKQADLAVDQTSWADPTAVPGVEYEYWMERRLTGLSPNVAAGYLSAGCNVPEVHDRGRLLLVVDDTVAAPLAGEIARLRADLAADGWVVRTVSAPRTGTAVSTKALIKAARDEAPAETRCIFILGHVPVPYSGNIAPDGHGDHVGAWPADAYYGDMDGVWTDTTVNNTAASSSRNDNIPGDGKFDQSTLPGSVELEVGRVDFASMTRAPSSGVTEVALLRRYLLKDHQFRRKTGPYADIPRRSIIRDGFGHLGSAEPFAAYGWAAAFSSVGSTVDLPSTSQWFTPAYASGKDYLFGHGCGGGSQTSASGFGTTLDYGTKPSRVVFTSLFGSYFGDWDAGDNLMRASIAGNAEGDSLGLTCFWSGRPGWFTHHAGMGETWGYATRTSMNAVFPTTSAGYTPTGIYPRSVHLGLMGDPALRMHVVAPPRGLAATTTRGEVALAWAASTEGGAAGYHVYRGASPEGPFTRLTVSPLASPGYIDAAAPPGQEAIYLVKTLLLESVPGGSYYNLSTGAPAAITPSADAPRAPANPSDLAASALAPAVVLAGYHAFDASTADESADAAAPGITSVITKSTDSRSGGGSDDAFYGGSAHPSGGTGDGFLRMTGSFTLTVTHGGAAGYELDALYFDATSISAGAVLNISCSVNGGAPVPLVASLALPVSTASDTETRPYGDFALPLSGMLLQPGDTVVFTASLGAGGARLDNLALAGRTPAPGNRVYLSWRDNATDETGFRLERRDGASAVFTTIATLPPDATSYTDASLVSNAVIPTYRVIALGAPDSIPSNEIRFEPSAGLIAFDRNVAAYDKRTGMASIPVTRSYGAFGAVTVNYTTSNSSATAGTHYTSTSGKLSWADGEGGTKLINVPLLSSVATPQQFKVTLSAAAGGAGIGLLNVTAALIEDPSAVLDGPWTAGILGAPSHSSAAVSAEGGIADSLIGGTAPAAEGTAESGRFIHQQRTGDGTIIARIRGGNPSQSGARFGVMVRSSLATNSPMAAVVASSSTSSGTRAMHRPTAGAETVVPAGNGNGNTLIAPGWVRLTRMGNLFVSEASSDGATWTLLASQSLPGIATTAYWGIYHCSAGISATNLQGDWHLAIYENAEIAPVPAPPVPGGLVLGQAAGGGNSISWAGHPLATTYSLERRGDDGSERVFTDPGTSAFTDATTTADTAYEYRLSAGNSGGTSAATAFSRIVTPAGALPLRPGFLGAVPGPAGGISLSWFDPSSEETSIEIERRAENGGWSRIHAAASDAVSFADGGVLPGVHYHYRVRNMVSAVPSSWAFVAPVTAPPVVVAPGTAGGYRLWLLENGLPMDESGDGGATAAPDGGELRNLVKYALGLPSMATGSGGRLFQGSLMSGGLPHASFSHIRPDPAPPGVAYVVESSPDLSGGSWTEAGVVPAGESAAGGLRSVTYRAATPLGQGGSRFFRLRVVRND